MTASTRHKKRRPHTAHTRAQLVKAFTYARDNHLAWARVQERRRRAGRPQVPHVGGATGHRKWARIYNDAVLELEAGR